jgi:Thymidylate kinase
VSVPVIVRQFPDRRTPIGELLGKFLSGHHVIEPRAAHLLFSANRWEANRAMINTLNRGVSLVVDRYIWNRAAHTAAPMDHEPAADPSKHDSAASRDPVSEAHTSRPSTRRSTNPQIHSILVIACSIRCGPSTCVSITCAVDGSVCHVNCISNCRLSKQMNPFDCCLYRERRGS